LSEPVNRVFGDERALLANNVGMLSSFLVSDRFGLKETILMQIRRADALDEEALASIRRDAILTLAVPTLSRAQAEEWATQITDDRIARALREHDVWVAVERTVTGWVEVDRDRIAALYVSPASACRGVGSALLALAETQIYSMGYPSVQLEASLNALNFYIRRGYLHCGPPDAEGAYPLRKDLPAVGGNS